MQASSVLHKEEATASQVEIELFRSKINQKIVDYNAQFLSF